MSRSFGNYANESAEASRKPYRYGSTVADDCKEDSAYDSEGAGMYQHPAPVHGSKAAEKNKKTVMVCVAVLACIVGLVVIAGIAVAMYFICCHSGEDNTDYGSIVFGYISKGQECPQSVITAFQQQLLNNEEKFNENMQELLGELMPMLKEMQNGKGTQQDVMVLQASMNALVAILQFAVDNGDDEEKQELEPLLEKFELIKKALAGDKDALSSLQKEAEEVKKQQAAGGDAAAPGGDDAPKKLTLNTPAAK